MPYKVFKEGEKYCVYSLHADGTKKNKKGCHATPAAARSQQSALYVHTEGKEISMTDEADRTDSAQSEAETHFFERMADYLKKAFNPVSEELNESEKKEILLYKDTETGRTRWITAYSNNFLDDDNPREIISEISHLSFDKALYDGAAPMPELWFWHVPEWKFGETDWHAYDDNGFIVASGTIDEGMEQFAKEVNAIPDLLVSHGMLPSTIERDPQQRNVIIRHETREISPLPGGRAANKLTGWAVIKESTEDDMAIPKDKREKALAMGISEDALSAVEAHNAANFKKATKQGIQSKETAEVEPDETPTEPEVPAEPGEENPGDEAEENGEAEEGEESGYTEDEVVEAVKAVVKAVVDPLVARLDMQEALLKELTASDETKIKAQSQEIPRASLQEILQQRIIGKEDARVDKSDKSLQGPEETESDNGVPSVTGIPWLDQMITEKN
jgi:hypothetical protein